MMRPDHADLLEDLASIEDASAQLQLHFEELRRFGAPIVLQKSPPGLREIVQHLGQNMQFRGALAKAKLVIPNEDIQCRIDSIRIEQVMRNLFENAIAACNEGARIEVDWSVDESTDNEMVLITVRDNGPGFTAEQRISAFEPFFATKGHGSGLGLPICRRNIEAHGGTIDVKNIVDGGAAIVTSLPRHLCTAKRIAKAAACAQRQPVAALLPAP
jgi:signal transduction histidine kinase